MKEGEKSSLVAARRDRLALFGKDAPRIVRLISDNIREFDKKPIGPIGDYIFALSYCYVCYKCLLFRQLHQNPREKVLYSNRIHAPEPPEFLHLCITEGSSNA